MDITGAQFGEYGAFWVVAMAVKQVFVMNNVQDASRCLCVKDGPTARRAALLSTILFVVGPVIWFLPPMAARIVHPDLHAVFPALNKPSEGAYVAIAMHTMPAGLLGLPVTGIFATTMASMDTGLNRNAGIFVKSVYQPLLRPQAGERELVIAGKVAPVVFGLLVIGTALVYSSWKNIGLFKLMVSFSVLVGIPYSIPLFWCLLIKKPPPWSGWSTVLVGLAVSIFVSNGPEWGWSRSLLSSLGLGGVADWAKAHDFTAAMAANVTVGSLAYSSAKGAVLTWNRALAVELAPRGIRVNAVAPGLILGSRFHDTHTREESVRSTVAGIPLARAGTPDDVARAVVFLASEYDGFITGATLDINGGVYCA